LGNHFWDNGNCAETVGLDAGMIRKYVRIQEQQGKQLEQMQPRLAIKWRDNDKAPPLWGGTLSLLGGYFSKQRHKGADLYIRRTNYSLIA